MSGGHFNYMYKDIWWQYNKQMLDPELNELLEDFCDLLKDLEWYESGDTGEDDYRKSVREFKKKWLRGNASERLSEIVDDRIGALREEFLEMLTAYDQEDA